MHLALVSAVNLDSGVNEHFRDSEYEVSYGNVTLRHILFQDDVARLSLDLESVHSRWEIIRWRLWQNLNS